jgi:hypothetical protein
MSLLLFVLSAFAAAHSPTDVSEQSRPIGYSNALFLGSLSTLSVFNPDYVVLSVSSLALSPFGSTIPLEVQRVLGTITAGEVLVQVRADMFYPISYIYRISAANLTAMQVLSEVPINFTPLTTPLFDYMSEGQQEYLVAIDGFAQLKLMQFQGGALVLVQTIATAGTASFQPYSLSAQQDTLVVADLANGLLVFLLVNGVLSLEQILLTPSPANSAFVLNTTAWAGTAEGVLEFERNSQGQFEQLALQYPLRKAGLYPYYLTASEDYVGFVQYSSTSTSYITIYPRFSTTPMLTYTARFAPFVIVGQTVFQADKSKIKSRALSPFP